MKLTHLENVSRSHIIKLALTLTTILIVFFFYSSHHWDQNGCSLKRWNLICMNTSEMEGIMELHVSYLLISRKEIKCFPCKKKSRQSQERRKTLPSLLSRYPITDSSLWTGLPQAKFFPPYFSPPTK